MYLAIINRESGNIENLYNMDNVMSYAKETYSRIHDENHEKMWFMVEFKNLSYDMGMWEVDKYYIEIIDCIDFATFYDENHEVEFYVMRMSDYYFKWFDDKHVEELTEDDLINLLFI